MKERAEIHEVTCILCPIGCDIEVRTRREETIVENAGCERGIDYAIKEVKTPERDFFTTVRVQGGKTGVVSVRATMPLRKDMLITCSSKLANLVVPAPVKIGDLIVKNILNTGADVIATREVEKA